MWSTYILIRVRRNGYYFSFLSLFIFFFLFPRSSRFFLISHLFSFPLALFYHLISLNFSNFSFSLYFFVLFPESSFWGRQLRSGMRATNESSGYELKRKFLRVFFFFFLTGFHWWLLFLLVEHNLCFYGIWILLCIKKKLTIRFWYDFQHTSSLQYHPSESSPRDAMQPCYNFPFSLFATL